ncbi:F-box/kelch-repeat protein At1g57790-like isoform X2 [Macadamia integrifolia]|uniref:F-box/kelch-repeat protein At1g57790-like isoform X2 n=1 Tax=Macadamia integrifolia TaxID=60698 RepID=UPI001C4F59F3|nr:F-box/kelch-repeat protein At1g57790-like isoform X2 [Macadamia integrifolia]
MDYLMMTSSPCLIFSAMNNCNINLFYPMYNFTYTLKLKEELYGVEICFAKDGWLLLVRGDHNMFFLNPFTSARIEITYFPLGFNFDAVCFTSTPTSSDCTVFGIVSSEDYEVTIFINRCREETWEIYSLENKTRWGVYNCLCNSVSFIPSQSNPVLYGGLFYCFDEEGKLGSFDLERGSWNVFRTSCRHDMSEYDQNFLVECDGNLLSVFIGPYGRWIRVCRLDQSKMLWKDVNSLGDWMLFLSEKTSLSAKATVRGTGNKIYIQRFYANLGVFYSLATQKYHTFDGGYCLENYYDTTEEVQCTWMMT